MSVLIWVLAAIGGLVLVSIAVRSAGSTRRVLKAIQDIEVAGVEAVRAILETPDNERRQFAALVAWDAALRQSETLTRHEKGLVVGSLRDHDFPLSKVARVVDDFRAHLETNTAALDDELRDLSEGRVAP